MNIALLIIDPQVDFCDPQGALSVPGADADMGRLTEMVRRLTPTLDSIHVTLDTHHFVDIAHPIFWRNSRGEHPAPFTLISAGDVQAGRWMATRPEWAIRARAYVETLERHGRYPLCIWPPHCLIGSLGHAVFPELFAALQDWERQGTSVDSVFKGRNPWTEHYSAIRADVPDPADPSTQTNSNLVETLRRADRIAVAGEAGSHCVANTVRDLADCFGNAEDIAKIVLLADAISPVPGFEALQDDFLRDMTACGMALSTTTEFLA